MEICGAVRFFLAKWLATDPKVLLLDESTRWSDVHAKAQIYAGGWKHASPGGPSRFCGY